MAILTMVRRLGMYWRLIRDPKTPRIARLLVYAGLAYTLMPLDLLPDWIPVLGLLDDASILPVALVSAVAIARSAHRRRGPVADAPTAVRPEPPISG
jgi:uncharacterized membrane protein YkvA (DUF1232 family)